MLDKSEKPAVTPEAVAKPIERIFSSDTIEKIEIKGKTMKTNVRVSAVGLFLLSMGLLVSACVGQTEPTAAPSSVGEVQQDSQSCSSDCSGVEKGIPFSMTCTSTCTATTTGITCDSIHHACQQNCSPLEGQSCGTFRCSCMSIAKHYDCDGVCVPDDQCSCCGKLPC